MNLARRLSTLGLVTASIVVACSDEAATPDAGGAGATAGTSGSAGRAGNAGAKGTAGKAGGGVGGATSGGSAGTAGGGGSPDETGTGGSSSGAAGQTTGSGGSAGQNNGAGGQSGGSAGTGSGAAGGPIGGAGGPAGGNGAGANAGSGNVGGNGAGANAGSGNVGGNGAGASGGDGAGANGGSGSLGGSGPGGSGGGAPIPKGLGACAPAQKVTLGAVVNDTLASATTFIDLSCGTKAPGGSALYEILPTETGAVEIAFQPPGSGKAFSAYVTLESDCAGQGGETVLCPQSAYEKSVFTVPATAGVPITMAVTIAEKSDPAAPFRFTATNRKIACGDGKVDLGEQCDPPNGTNCSPTCRAQTPPCGDAITTYPELCDPPGQNGCSAACVYDTCPASLALADAPLKVTGTYQDKKTVLDICGASATSRQVTYDFVAKQNGVVDISLDSDTYTNIAVLDSCSRNAPQRTCTDLKSGGKLTLPVKLNEKLAIVLTAAASPASPVYAISAVSRPVVCGDTKVDPGEECDPPDGLTCSPQCRRQPPPCGDGIVTLPEQCDPPAANVCGNDCRYLGCPNIVTLSSGGPDVDITLTGKPWFSESCSAQPGAHQIAAVIDPPSTGTLTLTLGGDAGGYIGVAAETVCGDAATNTACESVKLIGQEATLKFPVSKSKKLYLVFSADEKGVTGSFKVRAKIDP